MNQLLKQNECTDKECFVLHINCHNSSALLYEAFALLIIYCHLLVA